MGFIKLERSIVDWEWFTDGNMLKMWIYLLESANYSDGCFKGIEIRRGQVLVGRKKLAEKLGMSEQCVRTCLHRLEKSGNVTIQSTNRFSLITIVKYGEYQDGATGTNHLSNQQLTNDQPTTNQQLTTFKEYKKNKKKEKYIDTLPVYDSTTSISLDPDRLATLLDLRRKA